MNENIERAVTLYKDAYRKIKTAEKLLEAEKIEPILLQEDYFNSVMKPTVMLYSGIKNLETESNKVTDRPPLWHDFAPDHRNGWIKINGLNFVQLKSVVDTELM